MESPSRMQTGLNFLVGAGQYLDSTASVEMALQRDTPKWQVFLWSFKSDRLLNPSSATSEQHDLKTLNLSMCQFPICKIETQIVPTSMGFTKH